MTPQGYCQDRAAPRGSSAYYALLFAPPGTREPAAALLAFRREVGDVPIECSDPGVARAKLDWWRAEIDRAFRGEGQHPISRALAPAIAEHRVAAEQLLLVVDGVEGDLDHPEYPSSRELGLYCHQVGGMLWMMLAEVFGYQDRQSLRYAQGLGTGIELAELIGALREDARRGHVRLPADEMVDFGVTRQSLFVPETSVGLRALLTVQARRAREHLARGLEALPEEDRTRQRPGLVRAAIAQATLDEIERDGFRVLERRVALPPLRKLWIALATAWREHRRESAAPGGRGGEGGSG
jgi:phytoene synthase